MSLAAAYVYVITATSEDGNAIFCKVGVSSNPWSRCYEMQVGCPLALEIRATYRLADRDMAFRVERRAHELLANLRESGEWFRCAPFDADLGVIDAILGFKLCGWEIDLTVAGIFPEIIRADESRAFRGMR